MLVLAAPSILHGLLLLIRVLLLGVKVVRTQPSGKKRQPPPLFGLPVTLS